MPSYTTYLGLTKPDLNETGWGAPVNANFDALDAKVHAMSLITDIAKGTSVIPRGAYSAVITYAVGDVVSTPDGSSYISILTSNLGNNPTASPTYWMVSALSSVSQVVQSSTDLLSVGDGVHKIPLATLVNNQVHLPALDAVLQTDGSDLLSVGDGVYKVNIAKVLNNKVILPAVESRILALENAVPVSGGGGGLPTSGNVLADGTTQLVVADGDFGTVIFDGTSSPVFDSIYGLQNAINHLNSECLAFSAGVRTRKNYVQQVVQAGLNLILMSGQSLASGFQTLDAYSLTPKLGNLCLGKRAYFSNGSGAAGPYFDNLFHGAVERDPSDTGVGETGVVACANFLKLLINNEMHTRDYAASTLVVTNVASPGQQIEAFQKTAAPVDSTGANLFSRFPRATGYCKTNALTAGPGGTALPIAAIATIWDQGEFNQGNTEAYYGGLEDQLRSDVEAQYFADLSGQTAQPGFYTYQTGGGYAGTGTAGMGVEMAQWDGARLKPNHYLTGPHYQYRDLGGHKIANSYLNMGIDKAKCIFRTAFLRQEWFPLGPHKGLRVGNVLLVGYHVPAAPLTFAESFIVATSTTFSDKGFTWADSFGPIPFTVAIVADTVLQFTPQRQVDWSTEALGYADGGHSGRGNVADSDRLVSPDLYQTSSDNSQFPISGYPAQPSYGYNDPAALGKPLNSKNFSVAFYIAGTSTFAATYR